MKLRKTITATLLASALMITLPGCDRDGPLEEAGEQIDEAVEDTGDAVEDATDGN
jgi:predicted small lipoprotein YifL